jgi:catechol-2,3-dioxygenase
MDLQERARKAGVQASDIVDHSFARAIYFEDPNGISLGFALWKQDLEMEPAFYDAEPVPALQQIV